MVVSSIVLAIYSAVKSFFAFENARVLKILLMCFPLNISFFLCLFLTVFQVFYMTTKIKEPECSKLHTGP